PWPRRPSSRRSRPARSPRSPGRSRSAAARPRRHRRAREPPRTQAARKAGLAWRLRSERTGEPDVTFDRIPDVTQAVPDHQGSLDAESESKPAVAFRVDAARYEDPRVDHSAARDLDPALRFADAAWRGARPDPLAP